MRYEIKVKDKKKSSGNTIRFIGNTSWMMGQQIYSMVLSLIIGSLTARYLGPSNYGLINYGASIISFFTIISKLGLDSVIINEIVKNREKTSSYLGSALTARLIVSIASIFIVQGIVIVLEPDNEVLHVVTLLQAFAIVFQSYEVFQYWFQIELKMMFVSIATMIAMTVTEAWRVVLLATGASVEFFALSSSIKLGVCGIIVTCIFFSQSKIKLKFSFSDLKYLLARSHHYIISGLAVTLYSQIDKVMIGNMISSEALGYYTAGSTIACLWEFVPNAFINSARPLIMEKRETDYKEYIRRFQFLLLGITIMAILVGIVVTIFGKLAIWILYGTEYAEAYVPLVIILWSTGFAMLGTARNIWLVTEDLNSYSKNFTIAGAVINLAANAIMIPIWGIRGAAIATLISQFSVCFIMPWLFKKTREFNRLYVGAIKRLPEFLKWSMTQLRLMKKN